MNTQNKKILERFKGQHILVIGDFILDRYLDGSCNRLAPEASVPVIDIASQYTCLGGSANVAANLQQLGAQVSYMTLLGQDETAKCAIALLKEKGISSLWIYFAETGPTLTKTRLLKDGQMLYRFDIGIKITLSGSLQEGFLADIQKAYTKCDAVYISDYDKGTITYPVIELLAKLREKDNKTLVIDAKNYEKYKHLAPDIIKPNYAEGLKITGETAENDRVKQAVRWADTLWQNTQAGTTLLSLDQEGVVVNKRNMTSFHYAAPKVSVQNASGAGDTFLATFLLAHLSLASDYEATKIACTAASTAVQKKMTASCSLSELRFALLQKENKVISNLEDAKCLADALRAEKKIVFTNGCFDIFHSGHAYYLRQARALGDLLIVGINTDESVNRLKGAHRPVNMLSDRIEVLKQLECVDYIIPFGSKENDTPEGLIQAIIPSVFVKGEDYKKNNLPESELLESLGIRIEFLPYVSHQSTTKIIARVQKEVSPALKKIS